MRKYELTTLESYEKACHLHSRRESDRLRAMLMRFRKEHPNPSLYESMLAEDIIELHIMTQRLRDKTQMFDGERTDYKYIKDKHCSDISTEDSKRKRREFDDLYIPLMKLKLDYLRTAQATSINLNITDDISAQDIFKALSESDRKTIDKYRLNGSSNSETKTKADRQTE